MWLVSVITMLFLIGIVRAEIIDQSRDLYNNGDGTNTLVLHSGIRNVKEGGQWKRIEDYLKL